jgi:hypothetical protein
MWETGGQLKEDFSVDLCPWEPSPNRCPLPTTSEGSVRWHKTQDLSVLRVFDVVTPTPPVSPTRRPSQSLAHLPYMMAPFVTKDNSKAAAHEIGATSTYQKQWESRWEKEHDRQELQSMTCFASRFIDGAGIAIRQRGVLGRRCLLNYTTIGSKLSWRRASLELLQLAAVHRSGCTVKLTSSQTSWLGRAVTVKLVLDSELEAVMLELMLSQLSAGAAKAATQQARLMQ